MAVAGGITAGSEPWQPRRPQAALRRLRLRAGPRSAARRPAAVRRHAPAGPVVEFNIQTDPEAAKVVFEAGAPLVMVPLEVRGARRRPLHAACPRQPPATASCPGAACCRALWH